MSPPRIRFFLKSTWKKGDHFWLFAIYYLRTGDSPQEAKSAYENSILGFLEAVH